MPRPLQTIEADVEPIQVISGTDNTTANMAWVRASRLLLTAQERRRERLQRVEEVTEDEEMAAPARAAQ